MRTAPTRPRVVSRSIPSSLRMWPSLSCPAWPRPLRKHPALLSPPLAGARRDETAHCGVNCQAITSRWSDTPTFFPRTLPLPSCLLVTAPFLHPCTPTQLLLLLFLSLHYYSAGQGFSLTAIFRGVLHTHTTTQPHTHTHTHTHTQPHTHTHAHTHTHTHTQPHKQRRFHARNELPKVLISPSVK